MSTEKIFVTQPTLAPLSKVNAMMESIWETGIMTHNGPLVQRFEKETANYLGVKNLVAVSNGTLALQMAIRALHLKGEIITTPFTFIATISSIIWEGCTPVFVDIDPETFNIDPKKIEESVTKNTVAIMPVHVFGNTCDIEAIDEIAKRYNLKVIYDAAHSFGVKYKSKSVFEYGDISATSFHATKMLNTTEGGGCISQNKEIDAELRRIRFFGFDESKEIVTDGFNGKMTEVHAAVGLANLEMMDAALEDRKVKYLRYKEGLFKKGKLQFQKINEDCNYSYFPVVFENEETLLKCEKELNARNIFPRRYFYPSVNTFNKIVPYVEMPLAESLSKRILCLPLYYTLSVDVVDEIIQTINRTI